MERLLVDHFWKLKSEGKKSRILLQQIVAIFTIKKMCAFHKLIMNLISRKSSN